MTITKQLHSEIKHFLDNYWDTYFKGDLETWSTYITDDYKNIGGTEEEIWNSKKEIMDYTIAIIDQMVGAAEIRNKSTEVYSLAPFILAHEFCDMYVKVEDDWTFYGKFRLSSILKKSGTSWQVVHQHGSYPDSKTEKGEAFAFDKISTENRELKDAIRRRTIELENKTWELKIEASLERVRTVAMSMHKPQDLLDISQVLFNELIVLGFNNIRNALIHIFNDEGGFYYDYDYSDFTGGKITHIAYSGNATMEDFLTKIRKSDDAFVEVVFDGKDLKDWKEFRIKSGQVDDERIAATSQLNYYFYSFGAGNIGFSNFGPVENDKLEILKRFRNVFDFSYRRYLDIEKAEAQVREVLIENALEKVRSKTMAMQKSEELAETSFVLFQQFRNLGETSAQISIGIFNEDKKVMELYSTVYGSQWQKAINVDLDEPVVIKKIYEAWKQQKKSLIIDIAGADLKKYNAYRKQISNIEYREDRWVVHIAFFSRGVLTFSVTEPHPPETIQLLERFAQVFEQTYRRFLDLQKAEAQTREARINLAVERVRARALAMYNSEEILEVVFKLKEEVMGLEIPGVVASTIFLNNGNGNYRMWDLSSLEIAEEKLHLPLDVSFRLEDTDTRLYIRRLFSNTDNYYLVTQDEEDLQVTFQWLRDYGQTKAADEAEQFVKATELKKLYHPSIQLNNGRMCIDLLEMPSAEIESILSKMGAAFDLAYKRFEDLKKAEAQTREAQIELSLERIRAKVTAMKVSSDLLDIVVSMRTEFVALGHAAHYFWHMRWLPNTYEKAMTSGDGSRIGMMMTLPRSIHSDIKLIDEWEKSEDASLVYAMNAETAVAYINTMVSSGDFKLVDPNAPGPDAIRAIGGLTFIMARTTHGEIGYSLPGVVSDPPAEDVATLIRFAAVFDLAYRRFEDLKRSEIQIREGQIELALERVRARALAMQQPDELKEVAHVLRTEMGVLGIEELETCSIYIHADNSNEVDCWYALQDPKELSKKMISDHFSLNLNDTWVGTQMKSFYISDAKQTSVVMQGANRHEWIEYCYKHSPVFSGFYGADIPDRTYHLQKFSHGYIGAASPGEISDESWKLLSRAASVFSLAYSRFRDLTQAVSDLIKLKGEKKRAEDALNDLQITQKQLIQSEKMASLGELTAGIAHEIQNPLNFVNNFSEVNKELISELVEEAEKGNTEGVMFIAADIKQNSEKICHHGKRADTIVKGMLQHSRTSSGQKEPTDLNALADEYFRLAYHGLRAKDKTFTANIQTDYDERIGYIDAVPADIGRVILNLVTNAFYAVAERKKEQPENYEPCVRVSTLTVGELVSITVTDNGNGIPESIADKIFQPFFTTKPTGQGTGLGLSLSYDIVRAHGGVIEVESEPGKFSAFVIYLPIH